MAPLEGWWQPRPVLHRFVCDLVASELARQRRSPVPRPLPWPDTLALDADLGVDSLELVSLATALVQALHLHESGIEDWLLARRTVGDWVHVAQAGLLRFSARLTFHTSGSSGLPKACVHPLAHLEQEVAHLATLFPGRRRILSAVPSHHIYGFLFTVLLPPRLAPELPFVDLRAHSPAWLAHGAQPGDLVIGHPEYWGGVARTVLQLPPDVVGVTSTALCHDAVCEALEDAGVARFVQVYGASETGGIGWRESYRHPYTLMPHWSFEPGSDRLLRHLPGGGTQPTFTQDRLHRIDDCSFVVGPRRDDAIQVGGINVHPERVCAVLRTHPLVEDAAVRLMRPEEGARLKAFVVPKAPVPEPELVAQLRAFIDRELPTAERPKAITVGPRLPRNEAGKLADWGI